MKMDNYINGKINEEYNQYHENGILKKHEIYKNDFIIHTIL